MRTVSAREKIFFVKQDLDSMLRKIEGVCSDLKRGSGEPTQNKRNHLPVFQVKRESEQDRRVDRVYDALTQAMEQMQQAIAQLDIACEAQKEGEGRNG